jgi:hypothetical protein
MGQCVTKILPKVKEASPVNRGTGLFYYLRVIIDRLQTTDYQTKGRTENAIRSAFILCIGYLLEQIKYTERSFMINLVIKCFLRVQDAQALIPVSGNKGLFYCPCRAPFCSGAERFSQTWLPHSKFHSIHHSLQDHRKRINAYIVRDALPDRV